MGPEHLHSADDGDEEASRKPAPQPVWFLGKELRDGEEALDASTDADRQNEAMEEDQDFDPVRVNQLEAYMRYARMRETPRHKSRTAPPEVSSVPPQEPRRTRHETNVEGWLEPVQERLARVASRRHDGFFMRDIAIAGAISVALGALAGVVLFDRTNNGEISTAMVAQASGFWPDAPANGQTAQTPIAEAATVTAEDQAAVLKKPVATARLDVTDAKGEANTPIPLMMNAESALPGQDLALRLTGLPENAYLSAGMRISDDAWILRPGEETGVKLVVPPAQTSSFAIAVEAIETRTGDLAAPAQEITVALNPQDQSLIEPASTAPADVTRNFNLTDTAKSASAEAMPVPPPLDQVGSISRPETDSLLRNGDTLMELGDLVAARTFYVKARDLGDKQAVLKLGQTYDPTVFAAKNVRGLKPDPALALKYYLEARSAGIEDATTSISGLEAWLQK